MKVVSQTKKSITVELSPLELDIIRAGVVKERGYRKQEWERVTPRYPEELMYHAIMRSTSDEIADDIQRCIVMYRDWGILK